VSSETLTTWYLESREPAAGELTSPPATTLVEAQIKQFEVNRFLYQWIGGPWQWRDRLDWTEQQWRTVVEADHYRTWIAWQQGSPCGYFELEQQGRSVQIAYFGLAERFLGRGLGAWLLSAALDRAWAWPGTERVWVHTCSLDHPAALDNYRARGMRVYRTESG
jgi:GNAT superfamily N-acetyltransferase